MKINDSQITWLESECGQLAAYRKLLHGKSLQKRLLKSFAIGMLLALASFGLVFANQPFWDIVSSPTFFAIAFGIIVIPVLLELYATSYGKSVVINKDRFTTIAIGSKVPVWTLYKDIDHCRLKNLSVGDGSVNILEIHRLEGKSIEIALPGSDDREQIVSFLEDAGVKLERA